MTGSTPSGDFSDSAGKNILTISLSKQLTGEPISNVLDQDWQKANAATRASLNNVGFDVDGMDTTKTLEELRAMLHRQAWNGVILGWCLRGHAERTELFEQIARLCVNEARVQPEMELMFCTGPQNLMDATLRTFPQA